MANNEEQQERCPFQYVFHLRHMKPAAFSRLPKRKITQSDTHHTSRNDRGDDESDSECAKRLCRSSTSSEPEEEVASEAASSTPRCYTTPPPTSPNTTQSNRGEMDTHLCTPPQNSVVDPKMQSLLKEADCGVCLESLVIPCSLPCGHSFCRQCLFKALRMRARCPVCKTVVCAVCSERLLSDDLCDNC